MQPVFKLTMIISLGFAALTASFATARPGDRRPPGGGYGREGIQIQAATYGANCGVRWGNVTRDVAWQCNGRDDCAYQVNVNKIGDPAYGCAKDFRVEYVCPGGQRKSEFLYAEANQQTVWMRCESRRGIRVISATYGGNFPEIPKGNVTGDIARECNGRMRCDYFISVNKIGDPKYGWSKDYRVEYTCNGRDVLTGYVNPEANTSTVTLYCR